MNLLALLDGELKDKDWSIDLKKRYLYLRSCELFSYDPRYNFCGLFADENERRKKIKNRYIDLENLEDSWVICTSYARDVYSKMVKELLNVDCDIIGAGHVYAVMKKDNKLDIVADATYGRDFTRVKMGLSTYGYHLFERESNNFKQDLKEKDKKLGYLKEKYPEVALKSRAESLYQEFVENSSASRCVKNSDDFLIYKMNVIEEYVNMYQNIYDFSDLVWCISYLQQHFLNKDCNRVKAIALFNGRDDSLCSFAEIYPVELKNDMMYYAVVKEDNHYVYKEISKEEVIHYINDYKGNNKNLIYHR